MEERHSVLSWTATWCRSALGFNDVNDVASYVISMAVSSSCAEGELAEYVGALTPSSPAAVDAFCKELRQRIDEEDALLARAGASAAGAVVAPMSAGAVPSMSAAVAAGAAAPAAAVPSTGRRKPRRTKVEWRAPLPDDFDIHGPVYNCHQCGCVVWLEIHGRKPCPFCSTPLDSAYIQRKYYPESGQSLPKHERRRLAEERSAAEERRRASGKGERDANERQRREDALAAQRAEQLKERLLGFDRDRGARSRVFDDDNDYFETSTSVWSTEAERAAAGVEDAQRREKLQQRGRRPRYALDLAGRKVVAAAPGASRAAEATTATREEEERRRRSAAAGFQNDTLSGKAEEVYLRIRLRRAEAEKAQGARLPAASSGRSYAAATRQRVQHSRPEDDAGDDAGDGAPVPSPLVARPFIDALHATALLDAIELGDAAAAAAAGSDAPALSLRAQRIARAAALVRRSGAQGELPRVTIVVGATRSTVEATRTALHLVGELAAPSSILFTGGDLFTKILERSGAQGGRQSGAQGDRQSGAQSETRFEGALVAEASEALLDSGVCTAHIAFQNERHRTRDVFYPAKTHFLPHSNDMRVAKKTKKTTAASVRTELHCGGGHTLYSGFASESTVGLEGGEVHRRALGAVRRLGGARRAASEFALRAQQPCWRDASAYAHPSPPRVCCCLHFLSASSASARFAARRSARRAARSWAAPPSSRRARRGTRCSRGGRVRPARAEALHVARRRACRQRELAFEHPLSRGLRAPHSLQEVRRLPGHVRGESARAAARPRGAGGAARALGGGGARVPRRQRSARAATVVRTHGARVKQRANATLSSRPRVYFCEYCAHGVFIYFAGISTAQTGPLHAAAAAPGV